MLTCLFRKKPGSCTVLPTISIGMIRRDDGEYFDSDNCNGNSTIKKETANKERYWNQIDSSDSRRSAPYIRWACIAWWCRCDPQVECPGAEPLNSEVTSTTGPGESGVSKGQLHHLIRRTAEHLPSVNQGTRIAQAHAGPRNTTISLIPYVWRTTVRFIDTVPFPLLEVKLYREYSNAATIFGNA